MQNIEWFVRSTTNFEPTFKPLPTTHYLSKQITKYFPCADEGDALDIQEALAENAKREWTKNGYNYSRYFEVVGRVTDGPNSYYLTRSMMEHIADIITRDDVTAAGTGLPGFPNPQLHNKSA